MIKFDGEPPKAEDLAVTKNHDVCGKSVPDPRFIISGVKEIKNVVVTLEGIEKGKKAVPVKGAVLDNVKCVFNPHVQAVTIGTTLSVVNSDTIMHNSHAYWRGKKTVFNLALPNKDQKIGKRLKRPGMYNTKCDAGHTWMRAYIYVSKTPYYSVTDGSGKFEISDVPPGTYKLKAWHEALGTLEKEVTVTANGEVNMDFSFTAK